MSRSDNPLAPLPKVWIPAAVALVVILFAWIFSGDFGAAELAALLTTIGYFVLAYLLPGEGVGGGGGPRHRERREMRSTGRERQGSAPYGVDAPPEGEARRPPRRR